MKIKKISLFLFFFFLLLVFTHAGLNKSRNLEFDYEILIDNIPSGATTLKVWFPQAQQTPYQEVKTLSMDPKGGRVVYDKNYNNGIIYYSLKHPKKSMKINVRYKIQRYEYSRSDLNMKSVKLGHEEDFSKYLISNTLMVVTPEIEKIAIEITKGKKTTMQKARAIYDYVIENVSYDKRLPGWGKGDTKRACLLKAGNCTDFHSLFVSLARSINIPAKFVIGILVPKDERGQVESYHCWAEFYDENLGWIPVDISEAWKDSSKQDYYFGSINEDRVEFSQGRDIVLEPKCRCGPLNYFFYPYAEIDGKSLENIKTIFRFKDLSS